MQTRRLGNRGQRAQYMAESEQQHEIESPSRHPQFNQEAQHQQHSMTPGAFSVRYGRRLQMASNHGQMSEQKHLMSP